MKIYRFEDIFAWQKAKTSVVKLYELFAVNKDFRIRDQLLRAAINTINIIAEGYERICTKELIHIYILLKDHVVRFELCYTAYDLKYILDVDLLGIHTPIRRII